MYKRIMNIIFLFISLFCILKSMCLIGVQPLTYVLLQLLYISTILLFINRKNKGHIYNIITLLCIFISSATVILILVGLLKSNDLVTFQLSSSIFTLFSIFGLITLNIIDFKKELCKTNFILTIITSLMIVFVFIRFIINYDGLYEYNYIYSNNIYIMITSLSLLVHYFVNRKKTL